MKFDNSAARLLSCDRAFWLRVVKGYDPKRPSLPLQLGNATHFVMENVYTRQINLEDKTALTFLSAEAANRYGITHLAGQILISAMMALRKIEKSGKLIYRIDGTPLVEVKFCETFTNGVEFTGTIDRIDVVNDKLRILDYKTTSRKGLTGIGDEYVTTSQLRFYANCLRRWADRYLPSEYAAMMHAGQYFTQYLIISMNGSECEFSAAIPPMEMDMTEFADALAVKVQQAIEVSEETTLPPPTGRFHEVCKNCDFNHICSIQSPSLRDAEIERMETSPYNPLAFRD